jgi:hypothetical protein
MIPRFLHSHRMRASRAAGCQHSRAATRTCVARNPRTKAQSKAKRPPERRPFYAELDIEKRLYRIIVASEFVTIVGLPALVTWVAWT